MRAGRPEGGMALVITLTMMVLITAAVVEFAHGVYVQTGFIDNWRTSREMSSSAKSGASIAAYLINRETRGKDYTYPGTVYLPPADPFMDGTSMVSITVQDEDSKFNLNKLIYSNGDLNEDAYESFLRMLRHLSLDTTVADSVADWLDPDDLPRLRGSEDGVRNSAMQSTEELLLVPGVTPEVYDKLVDYVTVFGSGLVNINGAELPVLLSLSGEMNEELAKRLKNYRGKSPFKKTSDISKVTGFEKLGISLMGSITVKGSAFRVLSKARSEDGIRSIIECVMDTSGNIKYWREF